MCLYRHRFITPPMPIPKNIRHMDKTAKTLSPETVVADKAEAQVQTTMIISSIPYIRLRPFRSAKYPKPSCPIKAPT